ncbi:hypothetical protein ABBQ38_003985 [Trebouxia sp. C0009 RCD-2024]
MPSAFVLSSNRQSPQLLRVDPRFNRSRICPGRGSCRYLSRNKLNTARVIVRMAHTVFVYGTLLSEEIVKILLRRNPDSYAATVQGYSRYRIKGRVYPAILPTLPSDELTGMVLCGLSEQEFEILDEYEDEDYYRTQTTAHRQDNGAEVPADIYVWKDSLRDLLYGLWDYEEFRRLHLKEYMVMCQGFGADFTSKDMLM